MTALPARDILDGSKTPATKTYEFQDALGDLRDFIEGLLGTNSSDKAAAMATLGALPLSGGIPMTGMIVENQGSDVASAATTNIWALDGNTCRVTGTTTITSFGTAPQAGAWKKVVFDGALTLTHSANLNLNAGGANITTAAGDLAIVRASTTTQFAVYFVRKNGKAVVETFDAAYKAKLDGISTGATVGLGEGQTWQNMTASRVKGTTYYNTTGRTISVAISGWNSTVAQGVYFFTIGGVTFDLCQATGSARWHVYLPIPDGESYVLGSNIAGFDYWNELR